MNKQKVVSIISKIAEIKKDTGLKIMDTHVHPLDVMGVVHYKDVKEGQTKNDFFKSGILEKFNYGGFSQFGSKIFSKVFPKSFNEFIKIIYAKADKERVLGEMEACLVDNSVLLPIEPWLPTKIIADNFSSEKLSVLGSVDIHSIKAENIDSFLLNLVVKYNIKGIKIHPNLQGFKPQPSQNPSELAEKLHKLYKFAERERLYILTHGGISYYTDFIDPKYGKNNIRGITNAILSNFCDRNGKSEIFSNYNIPIIIAHLGHYGIVSPDYELIKTIVKKFNNVYFDTAGVSPNFIKNALQIIPSKKIIFGSDALYNRVAYNLAFLYSAVERTFNGENKKDILSNILQNNFLNINK